MSDEKEPWHLQRGVPIALIITILAQTFVAGWFVSELRSAVDNNNSRIAKLEQKADAKPTATVYLSTEGWIDPRGRDAA